MDDVVIMLLVGHMHVLAGRLRTSGERIPIEDHGRLRGDVGAMTTEAVINEIPDEKKSAQGAPGMGGGMGGDF